MRESRTTHACAGSLLKGKTDVVQSEPILRMRWLQKRDGPFAHRAKRGPKEPDLPYAGLLH